MAHQSSPSPDSLVNRPPLQPPPDDGEQLGRRTFLMKLGVGTAAIAGYFVPGCSPSTPGNGPCVSTLVPKLADRVSLGQDGDMTTLRLHGAEDFPLCAVNRYGADVVALLDGRHTIRQIASTLADRIGVPLTDAMQSQIAYFITQVGEMGFLQEPYYACIIDTMEG